MKKLFLTTAIIVFGLAINQADAQTLVPDDCQNSGLISGQISSQEGQGFKVKDIAIASVDYFDTPEVPYISGFVTVTYVPDCDPLEPCPLILKVQRFDMIVINNNGTCKYELSDAIIPF